MEHLYVYNNRWCLTSSYLTDLFNDKKLLHEERKSKIYSAYDIKLKKLVILKEVDNSQEIYIKNELDTYTKISNHPNICEWYGAYRDTHHTYIVLEYIRGYDLIDERFHNNSDLDKIMNMFKCMISAIKHLHEKGIVHMDLKPENIMYDEENMIYKLIDFGLSFFEGSLLNGNGGTFTYLPPEIWDPFMNKLTSTLDLETNKKRDVWSLGIILYSCCNRESPYLDEMVMRYMKFARLHPTVRPRVNIKCKLQSTRNTTQEIAIDFMKKCLVDDYTQRASITEF